MRSALLLAAAAAAAAVPTVHADDTRPATAGAPAPPPAPAPADAAPANAAPVDAAPVDAAPVDGAAVDAAPTADDDAALAAAKKQKKKAKEEAKRKKGETLEVGGRIFGRATAYKEENLIGTGAWTSELTLASARINLDYQWRERVRAKLSYEAAKSSVRDAYVELDLDGGVRVRAGRMKLPVGALAQTSSWTLPTIDRGMAADVLSDGVAATGRRNGLELRWRGHGPLRPAVTLSLSQGVKTAGGQQPGLVEDGGGVTVAGRVEVEPAPSYAVAVTGESRVVNYGPAVERYWNAGVEVEADLPATGLRLWGDAMYGTSHLGAAELGDASRPFAAAALTVGYRLGGRDRNAAYVEPFVGAGWVNPVADRKRDDVTEVVVGVAGGLWKRWRAQGQFGYQNAKALRPGALLGTADVNDRMMLTAQLGTAF